MCIGKTIVCLGFCNIHGFSHPHPHAGIPFHLLPMISLEKAWKKKTKQTLTSTWNPTQIRDQWWIHFGLISSYNCYFPLLSSHPPSAKHFFGLLPKVNLVSICILWYPLVICRHSPGALMCSDESALPFLEYQACEGVCYLDLTKMLSR